jgi:hypothetical protein
LETANLINYSLESVNSLIIKIYDNFESVDKKFIALNGQNLPTNPAFQNRFNRAVALRSDLEGLFSLVCVNLNIKESINF